MELKYIVLQLQTESHNIIPLQNMHQCLLFFVLFVLLFIYRLAANKVTQMVNGINIPIGHAPRQSNPSSNHSFGWPQSIP